MQVLHARPETRGGFTLAEVAVTIAIVAISLTLAMQVLNGATLTAAHTRHQKIARELGLYTVGQIESGLFWEDIDSGMSGSYAVLDQPDFMYEIVLGDDAFVDTDRRVGRDRPFDNWAYQRELDNEYAAADEDEEEEQAQPFEKVKIRVTYPPLRDFVNTIVLERWIPWEQVYGPDEAAESDTGTPSGTGTQEE